MNNLWVGRKKNSLTAAEYHIGTEITTDKQAACVVIEHICAFIVLFSLRLDVHNVTNMNNIFQLLDPGSSRHHIDLYVE